MQYGQGGGLTRTVAVTTGTGGTIAAAQVGVLPQTGSDTLVQVAAYTALFLAIWGTTYLAMARRAA